MKKELLAPAGDLEAGYAALYYGADAVYLGLQHFSARATAANFTPEALNEFTAYAHSLGRKVFVAVNTLVQEDELDGLLKTLDICSKYKVDAIIIQDLGVAEIVRKLYPELEMHASTQMAVHNKEGALALKKFGFSRVVLARELTLPEIEEIAAIPDLETEAFIHGALCYSYSGICLFSSLESGKSANRGKCLYPCRAVFGGEDGEKHYFSMKDMALQKVVLKMPLTSLKTGGRKKTALYVAAVTDYYRRILDGKGEDSKREENIKQIFSRPWTRFHFNGKNKEVIDRDFVGHRGLWAGRTEQADKRRIVVRPRYKIARHDGIQIDVPGEEKPFGFSVQELRVNGKRVFECNPGNTAEIFLPPKAPSLRRGMDVYLASSSEVKGAYPYSRPKPGEFKCRQNISVSVEVTAGEICASGGGERVCLNGVFEPAKDVSKMEETVKKVFDKTGDTDFNLEKLTFENPDGVFVPVSVLNELRRGLYGKIRPEEKKGVLQRNPAVVKSGEPRWCIKTDRPENLAEIDLAEAAEIVFLLAPDTSLDVVRKFPKNKLRLALPTVCRHPQRFRPLVDKLLEEGYRKWEIGNYWGCGFLPETGIDLSFDAPLYMFNGEAVRAAASLGAGRVTLPVEGTENHLKEICSAAVLPVTMIVYQDVPLFTSADCIRTNPCSKCQRGEKWLTLTRNGVRYEALSRDCQIMLFDRRPLCLAVEAGNIPADYYRVDFCYRRYPAGEAKRIWDSVRRFEDVSGINKGNIDRPALL